MEATIGGNSATATDAAPASPATFEQAFASEPSPSPDPVDSSTTPPAAVQPGTEPTDSPQQPDERSPFIPRARFDEVLTARKQAEQQLAEWQQYAWAKDPRVQQIVQQVAASQGNPMAFFAQQFAELSQHPQWGPQLRSFLGQQFGGLRQRQEPSLPQEPQPDVAIYDQQGQVVGHTYSAKVLAEREAFLKQQWMQEINQSLAPKLQTLDSLAAREAQAAAQAQAQSYASSFMQELSALPGFDLEKHGKAIAAELAQNQLAPNAHPAEVNAAAYRAYAKVVLPTLGQHAQSQLLDNLQKKAAATSSINPGSAAPSTGKSYKSFADLPPDLWK